MPDHPFDIITCSWPRPVEVREDLWTSEPEWDAPAMPTRPQPRWESVNGEQCWRIDWRDWFRGGLRYWGPELGGEMRRFHVVFRLRVHGTGTLVFWDDDGSVIRRDGEVIHADRGIHAPSRSEVAVRAGDRLDVAQWQAHGGWTWGARLDPTSDPDADAEALLRRYLDAVRRRAAEPDGPPLKVYTSGQYPLRTVVAVLGMILNGYAPAGVHLFGEHQWSPRARALLTALLPFATVVPTASVLDRAGALGGPPLVELACAHWFVMKTCVGLMHPPDEYAMMDDDVFILDRLDDALDGFRSADLVFAPDTDYSGDYVRMFEAVSGMAAPLPTGHLNTGLYWLRNRQDPRMLAEGLLREPPGQWPGWMWEQGFLASRFVGAPARALPSQRYFYPYFDGLPGGMLGYPYASNPCGFASIHFGGLAEKPSDATALALAPEVLGRDPR